MKRSSKARKWIRSGVCANVMDHMHISSIILEDRNSPVEGEMKREEIEERKRDLQVFKV